MPRPASRFAALILAPAMAAAAVTDVDLPPSKPLEASVAVDGRLDDWAAVAGRTVQPLRAFYQQQLAEARTDLTAELKTAYDEQALYLAVAWRSALAPANATPAGRTDDWASGGNGLAVHLACEGMVTHLVSFPDAAGKTVCLLMRRDGERAWHAVEGGTAAIAVGDKAWGQELRIPWRALTRSGAVPAGQALPLMADLAWRELTTGRLSRLSEESRRDNTHFSYDVLTIRDRLFTRAYLPSPEDWGVLTLAERPQAPRRVDTLYGPGLTALTVGRPVQAPVIDGRMTEGEWPADAVSEHAFAPDFLGERFAMRVGLLADEQKLYLAARLTTPAVPLNLQPESTQQGFRGGDCLQLRLARGGRVVNLCAWPKAGGGLALTADGKDIATPFLLQHGAAGAIAAEAGAYTMELSLPWPVLFPGPAPAPGERLRATLQPWWAGLDPRFTVSGRLLIEQRPPLAFRYAMPRDAEVTIGVFATDGALLRWLTRSEMRKAGANTEWWDGRDQDGKPIPAGDYAVKAIYHDPLGLEHALTVANPGDPPWCTPDGSGDWLGDESNPQAATTDGEWVYLASPCSEKGFAIIGLDGNGRRSFGITSELQPRCVSLAVQGDVLFAVYCGPEKTDTRPNFTGDNADNRVVLRCYDKRTGAPRRFTISHPDLKVAAWPYRDTLVGLWELFNAKAFSPDTYGGLPRYGDCQFGEVAEAMGVAASADTVWISFHTQNLLRAFDAQTGAARPERDIPLEKPVSLQARPDGSLLAVSGTRIVRIDPASKQVTPVVTAGLAAPFGVAADKAGNIYVSDWRDSFQVKVFGPDGKPLRAIGTPGGRAVLGKWDANGMLLPRGIAVTDAGKLWVAEDDTTPRRVSVWDAASGALVRDYIGPVAYGGGASFWFEPGDRTVLHTLGCRFKLDWEKKTWVPEASEMRRMSAGQPFTLCGAAGFSHGVRTFSREGRDYAVVPFGYDTIAVYQRQGSIWKAVAAAGTLHRWSTTDGTDVDVWDSDVGKHRIKGYRPACFRGHQGDNFAWSDRNDDGELQPEEVTWSKAIFRGDAWRPGTQPEFLVGWGHGCGPGGELLLGGICKFDNGDSNALYRLVPESWTAAGVPLYDVAKAAFVASARDTGGLYADARGNAYAVGSEDTDADAITRFDAQGRKLWRIVGKPKPQARDVVASNIIGELELPGIGPVLGTWAWHGNWRPYLVSDDGLYIGTVQPDHQNGPEGLWGESWRFWYQAPDGTPYLINGANQAQHILRLTGLEKAGRFAGSLVITAADAALAAKAAQPAAVAAAAAPPITVAWRSTPPTIDGDLADWNLDYGAGIALGGGRSARAALARDAANLYLAWRVEDDSPLKNQGGNWQTLFLTGDCVDLMLAADPRADAARTAAAGGDQRLLFSVFQDKPVAVLYRPVCPGAGKQIQLMAARFDRIDLLEQAQVAVRRGPDFYTVEAAVPLAALGLDAGALDVLRGDVGVISSDLAGRDRVRRSYHFNQDTAMISDLTTEASLSPARWGEVRFPLGANQLRDGGFESGLGMHAEDGWAVASLGDGTKATTEEAGAHSGGRGLLIRQVAPVPGGGAIVMQRVAVRPGATYRLRGFVRGEGLTAGNRAEVAVAMPGAGGSPGIRLEADAPWRQMTSTAFTVPDGVDSVQLLVRAVVAEPGLLPTMAVDDLELVEAGK